MPPATMIPPADTASSALDASDKGVLGLRSHQGRAVSVERAATHGLDGSSEPAEPITSSPALDSADLSEPGGSNLGPGGRDERGSVVEAEGEASQGAETLELRRTEDAPLDCEAAAYAAHGEGAEAVETAVGDAWRRATELEAFSTPDQIRLSERATEMPDRWGSPTARRKGEEWPG